MAEAKKKKRRCSGKGPAFERQFCKDLSLWWTRGERDDVFWRTSNSGGRATVRMKKRQGTYGQYGDVQATDPIGQPLLDLMTIELKRGYKDTSIQDLLDKPTNRKVSQIETFLEQVMESAKAARTPAWMLVLRKDRREAVLFFPCVKELGDFYRELRCLSSCYRWATLRYFRNETQKQRQIFVVPWKEFTSISPELVCADEG